jgi:lipoate-protein ligase A
MNISPEEVINEFQRQFPKEFTIVVQAIQITKLQEQLSKKDEVSVLDTSS